MNEIIKEICKISNDSRLVSLSPDGEAKRLPFHGLRVGLRGTEAASTQNKQPNKQKPYWIWSSAMQSKIAEWFFLPSGHFSWARLCDLTALHLGRYDRRITVSRSECSRLAIAT